MKARLYHLMLLAMIAPLAGCGPETTDGNTEMDRMAAALNKPKPAPAETQPAEPTPPAEPAAQPAAQPTPPADQPPAEQQAAEPPAAQPQYTAPEEITAKDPKKGRVFHNQPGYLNAVFSARFVAENSLTFDKVKHATDLYQAMNGHLPKTHEVFMREIIEANYIELPELRDDYEYWYDGETGQLMMRKPIEQNAEAPMTNDQ